MKLASYIKTGLRHLLNHKMFSAIHILGLSISLTACILVAFYIQDELSYDNFWQKPDSIYRLHSHFDFPGTAPSNSVHTSGPIIHALRKDYEKISYASRLRVLSPSIRLKDNLFYDTISLVDPDIINIFDFNVIEGSLEKTLKDNSSIAINTSRAKKYFGNKPALDQIFTLSLYGVLRDYKVTAIYEDLPNNTQIQLDSMIAIKEVDWQDQPWMFDSWAANGTQLYFTMDGKEDISAFNEMLPAFVDRSFPSRGTSETKASDYIALSAMGIRDLHMYAGDDQEYRPRGNIDTIWTFSAVAMLILIIASVNTVNLSTARATLRTREVSVRKVLGANRLDLILQFVIESLILTMIVLLITLALVEILLPLYNSLMHKAYVLDYASNDLFLIIGLTLFVGLTSSIYPAFILASFHPTQILQAETANKHNITSKLRTILVIVQFSASTILITATGVVFVQMQYVQNKDLGFNSENLFNITGAPRAVQDVLIQEVRNHPQVISVTRASAMPPYDSGNRSAYLRTSSISVSDALSIGQRQVGYDFFKTLEIPILAGRTYDRSRDSQTTLNQTQVAGENSITPIVVNVSALNRLGIKETPLESIGMVVFRVINNGGGERNLPLKIVGVIADTNLGSLYTVIRPEVYFLTENTREFNSITARVQGDMSSFILDIKELWLSKIPDAPFSHSFIDASLKRQYVSQGVQASLFAAFSALAIIVSCLGLYGLASFTAERRTKEIGVRKVMGATIADIVKLLTWQFTKPILLANIIAWPTAFYVMSDWLEIFAYRIESSFIIGLCIASSIATLLIAWGTVASKSIHMAKTNPIKALRYE